MTGFDGAGHLAGVPTTRDAIDTAAYRQRVDADYAAAREAGIACVLEAIDWRRAERADAYDFETLRIRIAIARQAGVQIAWTLCHSSWPDDVDFASPATIERFARFARAAAVAIADADGAHAPLYTPVNEIPFLAWALAETSSSARRAKRCASVHRSCSERWCRRRWPRAMRFSPSTRARASCTPSRCCMRRCRATRPAPRSPPYARSRGTCSPGGSSRNSADIRATWTRSASTSTRGIAGGAARWSAELKARQASVSRDLLADVHARHAQPIIVAETSAGGSARVVWMRDLGRELCEALESGIPVIGARLCRVAARPAWEDPRLWRVRRLWDALLRSDTSPVVDSAYAQALRDVQARVDPLLAPANRRYLS